MILAGALVIVALLLLLTWSMCVAAARADRQSIICRAQLFDVAGDHGCTQKREHLGQHVCACGVLWENRNRPRVEVLNPKIYCEYESLEKA